MAKQRILDGDIMALYPSAVIDLDYVSRLHDRFDATVLEERVQILFDEVCAAGHTRHNVGEHSIIDTARHREIHFFLSNFNYRKKIVQKIISKIKNV